jgi:serine/threonine protein phosphatase 1
MEMHHIQRLPLSEHGRAFVCGDIHGCFSLLENELGQVGFDESEDRLICVGDLIDRGPESLRALEFLEKPWFYSVMGNHELMLLEVLHGDRSMEAVWLREGGSWFYDQVPADDRDVWQERLSSLPIVIELETKKGIVGIVHAGLPHGLSWSQFTGLIQEGHPSTCIKALKDRRMATARRPVEMDGVSRVYCGHNIVEEPLMLGNVMCVDTGAYLGEGKGRLTLLEVSHVD